MIIDLILDRQKYEREYPNNTYKGYIEFANSKEGKAFIANAQKMGGFVPTPYHPKKFYNEVMQYGGYYADQITFAMDYFGENLVKKALCEYVINNEYNPAICDYI